MKELRLALSYRAVLCLLPFAGIFWLQWLRSIPRRPNAVVARETLDPATLALISARTSASLIRGASAETAAEARHVSRQLAHEGGGLGGSSSAASAVGGGAGDGCPVKRKPYHVVLTATAQVYQQWQCRIMYYHWKKVRDSDPAGKCTELTGFTRLVASAGGRPDGLEHEIPSVFTPEYDGRDLSRFGGYRVINRPRSVVHFVKTAQWAAIREDYILVAETDHVLIQPIPNRAERGSPMAYVFNYMGPNPAHAKFLSRIWPAGGERGYTKVQSIGPSPVLIHKADLEAIAQPWNDLSVALKTDREADGALGWVIEMWGYAVAAASIGLRHQEFRDFQVEPGALSSASQLDGFPTRYWIFHYTYQFEYMLDGSSCQPWTIGEFSLDKRHFSDLYPPFPLPHPPKGANAAASYLLDSFNEAMGALGEAWPRKQPSAASGLVPMQSLHGRRRLDWFSRHNNGFKTELLTMPLVQRLAGSHWDCGGGGSLRLADTGDAEWSGRSVAGGGNGRWGSMNDPTLGAACAPYACIFVDSHSWGPRNAAVDGSTLRLMRSLYTRSGSSAATAAEVLHTCTKK